MQALRDDFAKRYPGDAINSDEANAEWSKAYKELRESPEAKQREEQKPSSYERFVRILPTRMELAIAAST